MKAGTGMKCMPGWPKLRAGSGIQGALLGIGGASSRIISDSSSSLATWSEAAPLSALLNSERASNLRQGAEVGDGEREEGGRG